MPAADGNTRGWIAGSQLTGNNITVTLIIPVHTYKSIFMFVTTGG